MLFYPATLPLSRQTRRARQCPAQILAHLAQAPLLPLARRAAGQGHPRPADPRNRRMKTLSLSALSSVAVQQVAECAAGGNQRGGHQVDGHPGDAGEVARLVFDVGAGDGQSGEERHPGGRGQ